MNGNTEHTEDTKDDKKGEPLNLPPVLSSIPDASTGSKAKNAEVITPPAPSVKQEPVVTEIKAKVDLKRTPAEANEPVTLMSDEDFFKQQTNPTEGDLKQKEEDKRKSDALKDKLSSSNTSSSTSSEPSPSASKPTTPEKRLKQAEKWVKTIDLVRIWGLKTWSGQADDVGLTVHETDKQQLAEALADVMEEYNFNPAPLLTLGMMTVATFGGSFSNAYESRKKIRAFRKDNPEKVEEASKEKIKIKPELNPATGEHRKRRGGQFKS